MKEILVLHLYFLYLCIVNEGQKFALQLGKNISLASEEKTPELGCEWRLDLMAEGRGLAPLMPDVERIKISNKP